jgi:thiamine biosynthesis lipoprotein
VFTLELTSGSLSTTSNSEQPGHVLDPRTALPVEFPGSVVAWHERGLVADILTTALFVMGPERGITWAESRGFAACFLIPENGGVQRISTSAFDRRLHVQGTD